MNSFLLSLLIFLLVAGPSGAEAPSGIVVRLIAPKPNVCWGEQTLALEALVTNQAEAPIEITPDGMRYGVELGKKDKTGKEDRRHIVREVEPDDWQTINPQQTIIVPFKEPITGPFFDGPGVYKITVRYGAYTRKDGAIQFTGAINSNSVMFEIAACKKTP